MFQRRISVHAVRLILKEGEEIESYPEDGPHPSRLLLGWIGDRPLHVVAADDVQSDRTFVITVYEPTPDLLGAGIQGEEERALKCGICRQGDTRPGTATVTLERDEMTLVFKKVPAEVCEVCGEEYVSEDATARLLWIAEDAFEIGVKVDVREYVAA